MTREDFERRITDLLPDVSDQAMKNWLEYAENLDRDGTETESEIFDRSYVELALIKRHQSVETAAALFNYGEKFVFNYFELRGAAELLKEGWPLERISDHAVENGCDPTLEAMEESHAALEEFQSGKWDTRENKRKFSSDLSQGIRQFYALEQGLGARTGHSASGSGQPMRSTRILISPLLKLSAASAARFMTRTLNMGATSADNSTIRLLWFCPRRSEARPST